MELQISQIFKFAWSTYKDNWKTWVGLIAIGIAINIVGSMFGYNPETGLGHSWVDILTAIASMVLAIAVIRVSIAHVRKEEISITSSLSGLGWKDYLWYFLTSIVMGLGILLGLVLLIIPGIILALMWMFSLFLVLDKHDGVVSALKHSYHITLGHKWDLLALVIIMIVINVLGTLALLVGLLISLPVTYLAQARAYDLLLSGAESHKEEEVGQA
jgi:uncharacterized membrane protein